LSRVDVTVVRDPSTVTIEVVDDGRGTGSAAPGPSTPGSGQGLTGMKERAGIYGGTVEAGRTTSGGWRVKAVLTLNGNKGEE
jgi:signal transduction histidine kinase